MCDVTADMSVSWSRQFSERTPEKIGITLNGFESVDGLEHSRNVKKLLRLKAKQTTSTKYDVVYEVDMTQGRKTIRFTSPLQVLVQNRLSL